MEDRKNMTGNENRIIYQKKPSESCIKILWTCREDVRGKRAKKYVTLFVKGETRKTPQKWKIPT